MPEGPDAPSSGAGAALLALPAVIQGTTSVEDHADCFAIDIPCGAAFYAELNDGVGGAPNGAALELLDSRGHVLWSDPVTGPRVIDGTSRWSPAHSLPAGRFTLCVRWSRDDVPYFLDVSLR
jgi:hypothetical protein